MVDRVARAVEIALALALIAAVALNFVNVVGRYAFGRSLLAGDEVQTYLMVYMAFLGAALASWRGLHLKMDVLSKNLPLKIQQLLTWIEFALTVVLGGLVTWVATRYVMQMYALGAKSQTAQVPMWIPHLAVPLGFGLLVLLTVIRFVKKP